MQIQFKQWKCDLKFVQYENGNTAIQLIDAHDGALIAIATVNCGPIEKQRVAIKDYSENEGMLEALINGGIVSKPNGYIMSGFVEIPVCDLLIEVPEPERREEE